MDKSAPPILILTLAPRRRNRGQWPPFIPSGRFFSLVNTVSNAVQYDPFDDAILDDPFPVYAQLRAHSPVHYLERHNSWALARFEDIWSAGEKPECFASPGPSLMTTMTAEVMHADEPELAAVDSSVFSMNPPHHTTIRKQLVRHFSPRGVARLEDRVRAQVRDCLGEVLPTGRCDVIGDLAAKISVRVACLIIGLPVEDGDHLTGLVNRFFARETDVEGMPPDAILASGELSQYLQDAVRDRRKRGLGSEDVLDAYCGVEIEGERYSDAQLASHLVTLVVGGAETLPKVFAGGILQLHRHPDQRAEIVADPGLIPDAFVEIARYEMPTQFLTRTLTRDVELRGQQLRAGQGILFLYRSANRDELEFEEPDRFDIHRRPDRILSFGHGTHVCLGQHAARLEARVMLEELLAAVPDYAVKEEDVVPARSEFVAGYLEMPIAFEPRS
ncbi:cytochrome P450 [Myxococcota bacterium]|nr:cytochrome P450 [Myxococcota bacterium]